MALIRNLDCVLEPWNPCEKMTSRTGFFGSGEGRQIETAKPAMWAFSAA
jgi:hypothetical protein